MLLGYSGRTLFNKKIKVNLFFLIEARYSKYVPPEQMTIMMKVVD